MSSLLPCAYRNTIGAPVQVHTAGIIGNHNLQVYVNNINFYSGPQSGRAPLGLRSLFAPPACVYTPASLLYHLLYFWVCLPAVVSGTKYVNSFLQIRFGQKAGKGKFPGTETSARLGLASFTFLPFLQHCPLPPPFFFYINSVFSPLIIISNTCHFLVVRFPV